MHEAPYSNRDMSKSFNNDIFSTVIVVTGRGSCHENDMYECFISSVFKYAESTEAPED